MTSVEVNMPAVFEENEWAQVSVAQLTSPHSVWVSEHFPCLLRHLHMKLL